MKRFGNLFDKITDLDNLILAHKNARKGKLKYHEVKLVDSNSLFYLAQIKDLLETKQFSTSKYKISEIFDGKKKRIIHKLPYFPDRIIHHALLQVIEPILTKGFIRDTFQSIKGRGVSDARRRVSKSINEHKPKYCLKLDISKYYPSVDNTILKTKIKTKLKCKDTLWLIDNIVDSVKGLPIGNYTSQVFGNFYLTELDWAMKHKGILYFRYCDDIIVMCDSKLYLHELKFEIFKYLDDLKLSVKSNYQIFNIEKQGINFVGYIFRVNKILLRPSIAKAFRKTINKKSINSIMAYWGWIKPINAINLWKININKDITC